MPAQLDNHLITQANILGINPEKWAILRSLGVPGDYAKRIAENCSLELLDMAQDSGMTADELTQRPERDLAKYICLRAYLSAEYASAIEGSHEPYLEGLAAGFSYVQLTTAVQRGVTLRVLIDTQDSDITFEQLAEVAPYMRSYFLEYLKARKAGYAHAKLLEILRLGAAREMDRDRLSLEHYVLLCEGGLSHADLVALLERPEGQVATYTRLRVAHNAARDGLTDVSHALALEAIEVGRSERDYLNARRRYDRETLEEVLAAGLEVGKYESYRANHCRVTHEEVVQYARLNGGKLEGINDFLVLIDSGVTFDQLHEAEEVGIVLRSYKWLHAAPFSCSHDEILELGRSGMSPNKYAGLRDHGSGHRDIMTALSDLNNS